MGNEIHFDFDKVKEYAKKINQEYLIKLDINALATMSLFDKNCDGKITHKELRDVKKEDYDKYMSEVKQYNTDTFEKTQQENCKTYSYEELYTLEEDSYILSKNLRYGNELPQNINIDEVKNLKATSQMTLEEITTELERLKKQVGKDTVTEKCISGCEEGYLNILRKRKITHDNNSNVVDGHIGTYLQGKSNMCTVLAHLDTLPDEEIQSMYKEKTDENGNKYYEVTFPSETSPVVVTKQELDDGEITVTEDGKEINLSDFSVGDRDIRMFEMAYIKQFGSRIYFKGAKASETQNKFVKNGETKYTYNENLEKIKDYSKIPQSSIFVALDKDSIREKGLPEESKLQNGQVIKIYNNSKLQFYENDKLIFSLPMCHSMQFRRYDSDTNEIVLSGSNGENSSEVRFPAIPEILAYFSMTSQLVVINNS